MDGIRDLYSPNGQVKQNRKDFLVMRPLLIAFDSTQQALRAEMLLEYADVEIDIRPTPKEITAGCALSIEFGVEDLPAVREVIRTENVEIRGLFRTIAGGYEPVEV
jgi:hypothetical protein